MSELKLAEELSEIEKTALKALVKQKQLTFEELIKATKLNIDSARRATEWLAHKKLALTKSKIKTKKVLTKKGLKALEKGLPEKRLLKTVLKEKISISELAEKASLEKEEVNAALGENKKNSFIAIENGLVSATSVGKEFSAKESEEEKILKKIKNNEKTENVSGLTERGLIEEKTVKEIKMELSEKGKKVYELLKKVKKRTFVLDEQVEPFYIGKKQPYVQFLNSIRRKLTELGFKEMESPLIVQEFYNFDVLFQPQNHPARTWSDTYQLIKPKQGRLPDKKIVKSIKDAHEHGGISASSGWRYSWLENIAARIMPAAHGTAHSAKQLVKGVEMPGKYFAIARCFRPDVIDSTHLIEFNQVEGFVVDKNLNFKHLLGILKDFATEIAGAKKVRFYPDYYPFTEPSVQLSAKHPKLGWMELGGAGMFRPELLENLGIKGQAIAWGLGIDRLAMFKLGIKDIRELFSDNLQWLRDSKMVIK